MLIAMPSHSIDTSQPLTPAFALTAMVAISVLMRSLVAGLVLPFVAMVMVSAETTSRVATRLARDLAVYRLPQSTRIEDRHGRTVANVYAQNRTDVRLSDLSRTMVEALVAIEDYRFYEHGAFDLRGTLRALVTNAGAGQVVQGGSSITQQLVKQTLILQAKGAGERRAAVADTYARKLRELRYAIGLERSRSKDWILECYLNTVYFGDGAYGVQAAANHYFGMDAGNLTLQQSALLAGLVQNPSAFDPTDHPTRAIERRNVVLGRLAQLGAVSRSRVEKVRVSGLGLDVHTARNGCVSSRSPFFCAYVLRYLLADPALGRTRRQREKLLETGGLTIRTTLDLRYQDAADEAVRAHTDPTDEAIGALALVEPGTGEVRALAQSRPMGPDADRGETFLNYVVPQEYGGSHGFQAGSTFKVFVLAAAIEQGIPLSRTYRTPDEMSFDEADFENCPGSPAFSGTFTVGNHAVPSTGDENLYSGTRRSINTFYLQLERDTGVCAPYTLARQMGVRLTAPDGRGHVLPERTPIFPLGVADASPVELAEAYATFAARGRHCAARPVTAIEGPHGAVVRTYPARCSRVIRPSTADTVSDVLRGVIEPGGFASAQALDQPAAGKTGNNEGMSVWFVGYTTQLAGAAMIAGADTEGSPPELDGTIVGGIPVYGASASTYAAPIRGDAMRRIDDWLDDRDFEYPRDVLGAGVEQPDLARSARRNAGTDVGRSESPRSDHEGRR